MILLATYALAAIAFSWPLVPSISTSIPGVEGDAASYVWALGWAKAALNLGVNPFHTDYIFYPLGSATQLLWAVSLIGFASLPLQFAFGLITAHNLMYLAATVLTGYGTFLLAEQVLAQSPSRLQTLGLPKPTPAPLPPFATFVLMDYMTRGPGAAAYTRAKLGKHLGWLPPFVAGLVFSFAPLRLGYGLSFLNLFNTEFIPFYALFLIRAVHRNSLRDAILAGLFLGLNAYLDFQIAAFLVVFTLLYALLSYLLPSTRSDAVTRFFAHAKVVGLVAAVSLAVAAPMLWIVASDFAIEGGDYIQVYKIDYSAARSYDLTAFFVPNARSSLYANSPIKVAGVNAGTSSEDGSAQSPDKQMFIGYTVLALAAWASWRDWRGARVWVTCAILFALFSLGPYLHILGQETAVPLPYLALHDIPILNHIRIPMRYGIMVMLPLALLVAIALDGLIRSTNPGIRILGFLMPLFILSEYAVFPYPLQSLSVPRIYEDIARVPGDFTILEIPSFNWRAAAAEEVYQAVHEKRILRAYTNRVAPGPAEYATFRSIPITVRSMRALEGVEEGGLSAEEEAADKAVRDRVLSFYDLRYVVVHRQYLEPDRVQEIDRYLRDVLNARQIYDDGETIGYQLTYAENDSAPLSIDLRQDVGQMYAGRGWAFEYPPANWEGKFDFVWARGAESEIYFPVDQVRDRQFVLHAYAVSPQRVVVRLNGHQVGEIELTPEWADYTLALPAGALKPKMNVIQLEYRAGQEHTIGVTDLQIR